MRVASPPVMVTVTLSSFTETAASGLLTSALLSFFGSSGVDGCSASAAGAPAEPSMAAQSMAATLLFMSNAFMVSSLHIKSRETACSVCLHLITFYPPMQQEALPRRPGVVFEYTTARRPHFLHQMGFFC